MYCMKCGQELPEDAVACWKCGGTLGQQPHEQEVTEPAHEQQSDPKKSKRPTGVAITVILVVVLVLAAVSTGVIYFKDALPVPIRSAVNSALRVFGPDFAAVEIACENKESVLKSMFEKGATGETVPDIIFLSNDRRSMTVSFPYLHSYYDDTTYTDSSAVRNNAKLQDELYQLSRDLIVIATITKINNELGLPDSVLQRMLTTRALDGTQNETYDKIRITWTYHPDNGLHVIYEKV